MIILNFIKKWMKNRKFKKQLSIEINDLIVQVMIVLEKLIKNNTYTKDEYDILINSYIKKVLIVRL